MKLTHTLGLSVLALFLSFSSQATELSVSVEIPALNVAEYHRPYLAVWVEDASNKTVSDLAVLYDTKLRNNEGEDWLKDMRQWWRKSGRSLSMPIDGVTGATQGPGTHNFNFTVGQAPLAKLAAGEYRLRIEAAREVGGRELLNIPFSLPAKESITAKAQGSNELGEVVLSIKP